MDKKEVIHFKGEEKTPVKKKEPTPKGVMRYASKVLNKLAPQWLARQDLQKLTTEVLEVWELKDEKSYPKTFVKIIGILDVLIPLWKDKKELSLLKDSIIKINKKAHATVTAEVHQFVPRSQLSLTTSDIDHWVQTSKKNDQLVYYTGSTFSTTRTLKERQIFKYAKDLCFIFHEVARKKMKYDYRGSIGSWGCKYKNIVALVQRKVVTQQKNSEGTIISYPVYNYIMVKL